MLALKLLEQAGEWVPVRLVVVFSASSLPQAYAWEEEEKGCGRVSRDGKLQNRLFEIEVDSKLPQW